MATSTVETANPTLETATPPPQAGAAAEPTPAPEPEKPEKVEKPEKPKPSPEVEALNVLLRGELAAIATYRQAQAKAGGHPEGAGHPEHPEHPEDAAGTAGGAGGSGGDLQALEHEHREASAVLYQRIQQLGGEPATGAGAWGAFAKAAEGAARLFGNATALAVLKEGEEHGAGQYVDAQNNPDLSAESRRAVEPMIAQQRQHVTALEALIARAGEAEHRA